MATQSSPRPKIREVLKASEKHALSAQEVADELDYSRQHVDRYLRAMATEGEIGRVELGPAVGYYWKRNSLEQLEQDFEGASVTRPGGIAMPVLCEECGEELEEGDTVVMFFERTEAQWTQVGGYCPQHASDLIHVSELFGHEQFIRESLYLNSSFCFVHGHLTKTRYEQYDQKLATLTLHDVTLLELLGSRRNVDGL